MRRLILAASVIGICSALTSPALAQSLVRKPYLQKTTPNQATIVWTTDIGTDSIVRYGTAPSNLTSTQQSGNSVWQHEVTISGARPRPAHSHLGQRLALSTGAWTTLRVDHPAHRGRR